jgi:hypothetical protein
VPLYFFNLESPNATVADLVGRDLPDLNAARAEGIKLAAEVATSDAVEGRWPTFEWVEVVDESQRPIARVPLSHAIREPNRIS